jgi:hypothetical protein
MKMIRKNKIWLIIILCIISSAAQSQNKKATSLSPKMQLSELLINSTVKIESIGEALVKNETKEFISTSTGFFFLYKIDSLHTMPVLVTNFHCVQNSVISKITFTQGDSLFSPKRGSKIEFINENFKNPWIKHPEYDLAILPLNPIMTILKKDSNKYITFIPFMEENIANDSKARKLSAIEELLMIGYPKGYGDLFNNYPIVRKGTTATPLFSNFDNKKEFLLDIPIYSGSSGSPVILFNEGSYNNGQNLVLASRVLLIGIANQSIDIKAPKTASDIGFENSLNIAVVIKASVLLDFKPIFQKMLEQIMNEPKK